MAAQCISPVLSMCPWALAYALCGLLASSSYARNALALWHELRGQSTGCDAQGLATNFGMLLAAVMIAAVGGSVHLTLSISLVSDLLPPKSVR